MHVHLTALTAIEVEDLERDSSRGEKDVLECRQADILDLGRDRQDLSVRILFNSLSNEPWSVVVLMGLHPRSREGLCSSVLILYTKAIDRIPSSA